MVLEHKGGSLQITRKERVNQWRLLSGFVYQVTAKKPYVYYTQCINVFYIHHPQLQHTNAKRTDGSEVPIQVFYSEQDAVKACELAGQYCQAISKFKEKTAFVYTLTSNLNLFTEETSTLYVKAEFRENVSKYLIFIVTWK